MIRVSRPTKDDFIRLSIRVIYEGNQVSKNLGVKDTTGELTLQRIYWRNLLSFNRA